MKPRTIDSFSDILDARRQEFSNFMWVSRKLNNSLAYEQSCRPKPELHKNEVIYSVKTQELIHSISVESGIPKTEIEQQIRLVLDEIAFNKQLKLIRWLALVLTKICNRIYTGIHVNEDGINKLKSVMGTCPIIFAPSHRSYADFILLSYVCFSYDIEIPAIAAGMDFHAMWGMSKVLRNTGAFFMRRSFNDDSVYWETFKQYIHQLVTKGDLPIEFFIEGTRSRSCKSLMPKLGLLSMALKPLFTSEIPDLLIVPINISYERMLEEKLFAYEHLGVPKPKESTSGFFKSLSIIKENFGNVYFDFAPPISLKQYFGDRLQKPNHAIGPIHQQVLLPDERNMINAIAYETVKTQQKYAVITPFNLISMLLNNKMSLKHDPYTLHELEKDFYWLQSVMETLGALITYDGSSLLKALDVHKNLISVDSEMKISLIKTHVDLSNTDATKLKGHSFSEKVMTHSVPLIMLQLYVNPCLHYFIDGCFITLAMLSVGQNRSLRKDELFKHFQFLRLLFSQEFVFFKERELMEFDEAVKHLDFLNVIEITANNTIQLGTHEKLQILLCNLLDPFFSAYHCTLYSLQSVPENQFVDHGSILVEVQKKLEEAISVGDIFIHPYCLSLDTLGLCIQSLISMHVLERHKMNEKLAYKVNTKELHNLNDRFGYFTINHITKLTKSMDLNLVLNNQSKL